MKPPRESAAHPASPAPVAGPSQPLPLPSLLALLGFCTLAVAMVLALAVAIVPAAEMPGATPAAAGAPAAAPAAVDSFAVTADVSLVLEIETGNRLYPEWKETRRVHLGERFVIGDTGNEAVATRLLPDFRIVDSAPRSISKHLDNPAVKMMVYKEGAAVDSSWAFLNFPPHFSPRSFYTFQLKEITGYAFGPRAATAQPGSPPPVTPETDRDPKAKKAAHPGGASVSKED